MYVLSPVGHKTLQNYIDTLRELSENIAWILCNDLKETDANQPHNERIENARTALLQIRRQVKPVEAVIKSFLYALNDQEIINAEVGQVLQHWDFTEKNEQGIMKNNTDKLKQEE